MKGVNICGIGMRNMMMLGSGTITERAESIIGALKAGAAGAVTRTLRLSPKREVFVPNVFTEGDEYMINADNQNLTPWRYWIEKVAEVERYGRLGISLSAREPEDCGLITKTIEENTSPSFYEVNFSCSHSAMLYGRISYSNAREALSLVRQSTHKPVFLKLSMDNLDLSEIKGLEGDRLVDGYVLSNSMGPGLRINIKTGKPYLNSVFGGLSGKAVKPMVLAGLYRLRKATNKPIIGVGGIYTGADVLEYILAGASAVQVYTAAHVHGASVFRDIGREFDELYSDLNTEVKMVVDSAHKGAGE